MAKIIYDTGDEVRMKDDTCGIVCYDLRGARAVKLHDENGNPITVEITDENPVAEIF